jgi:hypothetical protein
MLPAAITGPLADHLNRVKAQHDADLAAGRGSVALLGSLRAKYPNAPFEWAHDAVHIVERYTPVTPNTIKYEATFDDPKVYTRARGRWF